jgi:hypothetical protein
LRSQTLRAYGSDADLKAAYRSGELPWSEFESYMEWKRGGLKDCRITIRISGFDLMKLKALAQMKEKRLYSYSEILRQEIHFQEERLATAMDHGGADDRVEAAVNALPSAPAAPPRP